MFGARPPSATKWRAALLPPRGRHGKGDGALLVGAERPPGLGGGETLRLGDIRDLVRVAERTGHMIVHCAADGGRDYFVREDATTYLYTARSGPGWDGGRAGPAGVAAAADGSAPVTSQSAGPAEDAVQARANGAAPGRGTSGEVL